MSDLPAPETPPAERPKLAAPSTPKPAAPEKKRPSRTRRFFRWSLFYLILLSLGVLAAVYLIWRPTDQRLTVANQSLEQANSRIAELEAQIQGLIPLETDNKDMTTRLKEASLHVQVLRARADVATARLYLEKKDITQARTALSKTSETLKGLGLLLPTDQAQVAKDMQERLALASKGLGTNTFAAQSDLDVLGNMLLQLENTYFAQP